MSQIFVNVFGVRLKNDLHVPEIYAKLVLQDGKNFKI